MQTQHNIEGFLKEEFFEMVLKCLVEDPRERPNIVSHLRSHPWISMAEFSEQENAQIGEFFAEIVHIKTPKVKFVSYKLF
jgi:hypothetical protein